MMSHSDVHVYCDASFSHEYGVAVLGSMVFASAEDHLSSRFESASIQTKEIVVQNNIRAELEGILWACEGLYARTLYIYSDCHAFIGLPSRRAKLESKSYKSSKTGKILSNADLYQRIFSLLDRRPTKLIAVKGHTPRITQTIYEKNFSHIDQHVRRELRNHLTQTKK